MKNYPLGFQLEGNPLDWLVLVNDGGKRLVLGWCLNK